MTTSKKSITATQPPSLGFERASAIVRLLAKTGLCCNYKFPFEETIAQLSAALREAGFNEPATELLFDTTATKQERLARKTIWLEALRLHFDRTAPKKP